MVNCCESIKVVYEHNDFYIVQKASGVDFHDCGDVLGFFSRMKALFPSEKIYPVHRLDKETSGLILVARSLESVKVLQKLLMERKVEKLYLAISHRKPKKKQGTIKGDMERSRRKSWKLKRSCKNPAITQFFSYGLEKGLRLFCVRIVTGKTHQIRVALKSLGSPIVGDEIYSGDTGDRLYLHSSLLRFEYKSEMISVRSLPESGLLWNEFRAKAKAVLENYQNLKWPQIK